MSTAFPMTVANDLQRPEMIRAECESIEWIKGEGAAADGSGPKKFAMLAYTGGALSVRGYYDPVVVDLTGLTAESATIPILRDHDSSQVVGHAESVDIAAATIKLAGLISGGGAAADEVRKAAANGFPWKASIGVVPMTLEEVRAGATAKANGKTFRGPCVIARSGVLKEVSFVAIGADSKTSVKVAAGAANQPQEGNMNPFEKWVLALGFDLKAITDAQRAALQAEFDAKQKAIEASGATGGDVNTEVDPPEFDVDEIRAAHAEHSANLEAISAEYEDSVEAKKFAPIKAAAIKAARELKTKAVKERWPAVRFEVEAIKATSDLKVQLVRAERPTGPAIHGSSRDVSATVIEAAMCRAAGLNGMEKAFKPEVLEAADKHRYISLQDVLIRAAAANGYDADERRIHRGNIKAVLRAAFAPVQAGFSTVSLPGLFSNIANKFLLEGFSDVEQVWREFSAIRNVPDFKQITSYRLLDDLAYEQVGPNGEIAHGTLGEESYTNRARTYAKMLSLTREAIINDDLGAFDSIRSRLGRGHGIKLNRVFWAEFLNNAAFFHADRANLITNVLGEAGIAAAELALAAQTDGAGNPIDLVGPHILLVPPALDPAARKWYVSQEIRDTTASTKTPTANIYQNKYRPVMTRYITVATQWYLVPVNGGEMAPMEVCFLDGQQAPIVESAEADFDTLGVQFRGYGDFGVAKKEWRGSVKSTGAGA